MEKGGPLDASDYVGSKKLLCQQLRLWCMRTQVLVSMLRVRMLDMFEARWKGLLQGVQHPYLSSYTSHSGYQRPLGHRGKSYDDDGKEIVSRSEPIDGVRNNECIIGTSSTTSTSSSSNKLGWDSEGGEVAKIS